MVRQDERPIRRRRTARPSCRSRGCGRPDFVSAGFRLGIHDRPGSPPEWGPPHPITWRQRLEDLETLYVSGQGRDDIPQLLNLYQEAGDREAARADGVL